MDSISPSLIGTTPKDGRPVCKAKGHSSPAASQAFDGSNRDPSG